MKVEQSESRKLLWYGEEEKWPGKMTFSDSAERRLKSCSLRVAWPGLSSGRIFANSPCLPGSRMLCMSVYICRHRLRCCSLLLLKSCCEVCHHREAEWFVCLPQLFFPCCSYRSLYFKVSPVTRRQAFCCPGKAEVSEVCFCFWLGLFIACPLDGCYRNNERVTCFLLWRVRKISPV